MSSATCMPHSSPQRFGEGAWERVEGGGQKERRRKERRGWRVERERRVEGEGGILFFPRIFFEMYTLYVALAKTSLVVLHFSPSFPLSPKSNQLTDRRDVQDCHQRLSSAIVSVPDPKPTLAWIAFSIAHGGYTGSDTCAR